MLKNGVGTLTVGITSFFIFTQSFSSSTNISHVHKRFPEWVHCQVVWILGGPTLNSFLDGRKSDCDVFLHSRLFTYDIMKNFNCSDFAGFFQNYPHPVFRGKYIHNLTTFYWSACTKPGKWAVMYLYVRGINFASFYELPFEF